LLEFLFHDECSARSNKKYIPVTDAFEILNDDSFETCNLNKKELFIREGQNNVSLAFIQAGILRCYNLKEGKEITNDFFFDNIFVTDYGSFLNGLPAKQNLMLARLRSISKTN
jgi:hypothetical protein